MRWIGPPRNIILDVDGSLTGEGSQRYITRHYPYFNSVTECTHHAGTDYDNSVSCSIPLRRVMFRSLQPKAEFVAMGLKIFNMN